MTRTVVKSTYMCCICCLNILSCENFNIPHISWNWAQRLGLQVTWCQCDSGLNIAQSSTEERRKFEWHPKVLKPKKWSQSLWLDAFRVRAAMRSRKQITATSVFTTHHVSTFEVSVGATRGRGWVGLGVGRRGIKFWPSCAYRLQGSRW